mgnify:CR=1 FL=1
MANKHGSLSIDSDNLFPIIKKWLYSDHDIFYRELISNGCDAITKLKKLALMGEYAGAKSNPEVIAPLNKLKSLIGNNGGGGGGVYVLKVKGRDLVAVLANETRINRKGTNIKI